MKENTRIVFFGTPDFSVEALKRLLTAGFPVVAAVTQPDRPAGRKKRLLPPAVKLFAKRHNIKVCQPDNVTDPNFLRQLEGLGSEFFVVVAYGGILPQRILDIPKKMSINLHASLLPAYRGAAPIARAILAGESHTGVSVIKLTPKMDAGPIIAGKSVSIAADDTAGTLEKKLARIGSELLVETLSDLIEGKVGFTEQDDAQATFAPKTGKEEASIDWSEPASRIERLIRAMNPKPGAYSFLFHGGKPIRCIIHKGHVKHPEKKLPEIETGTIMNTSNDGIEVATGLDDFIISEIQPAGKPPMTAQAYIRGHKFSSGDRFGNVK